MEKMMNSRGYYMKKEFTSIENLFSEDMMDSYEFVYHKDSRHFSTKMSTPEPCSDGDISIEPVTNGEVNPCESFCFNNLLEGNLADMLKPLQNQLAACGHSVEFDLPQIVILSTPGVNKSSFLESLLGREFLACSESNATRRPIVIQMHPSHQEYGMFLHRPKELFTNYKDFKQEIKKILREPESKDCACLPLNLEIYSPRALNLTVVNLSVENIPSVIKVAHDKDACVKKSKPISIVEQEVETDAKVEQEVETDAKVEQEVETDAEVEQEVETDANVEQEVETDASVIQKVKTDASLEQVNNVDKDLEQKDKASECKENKADKSEVDLKDVYLDEEVQQMIRSYFSKPGTVILAVTPSNNIEDLNLLKVEHIVNHKGNVGTLNRTQQDIEEGKGIQYICEKERSFFRNHPRYRHTAHRMGIPYLQQQLQKILRTDIRKQLAKKRNELQGSLVVYMSELRELKEKIGDNSSGRNFYIMRQVQCFIHDLEMKLLGDCPQASEKVMSAGARINNKLFTEVQRNLDLILVPDQKELTFLIANIDAMRTSISTPRQALEGMCQKLIAKYKGPMKSCVQCVAEILEEAIHESAEMLTNYPSIRNEILYRIRCHMAAYREAAQVRLEEHVEAEMYFLNLQHPDFDPKECEPGPNFCGSIGMYQKKDSVNSKLEEILLSDNNTQSKVKYVTTLIEKYLGIVKKQMGDLVVKYVVFFFVKKVLNFIKINLAPAVMFSPNITSLLEDCEQEFQRKEEIENECMALNKALITIQNF